MTTAHAKKAEGVMVNLLAIYGIDVAALLRAGHSAETVRAIVERMAGRSGRANRQAILGGWGVDLALTCRLVRRAIESTGQ